MQVAPTNDEPSDLPKKNKSNTAFKSERLDQGGGNDSGIEETTFDKEA